MLKNVLFVCFPEYWEGQTLFLNQTYHVLWGFRLQFGRCCSADLKLSGERWVLFFAVKVKTGKILLLTTEAVWQEKTW